MPIKISLYQTWAKMCKSNWQKWRLFIELEIEKKFEQSSTFIPHVYVHSIVIGLGQFSLSAIKSGLIQFSFVAAINADWWFNTEYDISTNYTSKLQMLWIQIIQMIYLVCRRTRMKV